MPTCVGSENPKVRLSEFFLLMQLLSRWDIPGRLRGLGTIHHNDMRKWSAFPMSQNASLRARITAGYAWQSGVQEFFAYRKWKQRESIRLPSICSRPCLSGSIGSSSNKSWLYDIRLVNAGQWYGREQVQINIYTCGIVSQILWHHFSRTTKSAPRELSTFRYPD